MTRAAACFIPPLCDSDWEDDEGCHTLGFMGEIQGANFGHALGKKVDIFVLVPSRNMATPFLLPNLTL